MLLSNLGAKDPAFQAGTLRYSFSDDTRSMYESLNMPVADQTDPKKILEHMEKFAKGVVNETMERYKFNSRDQSDGEVFDDYYTEIVLLSKNCNYCDDCYPGMIRDRIVQGIQSDEVRQKLLSEKTLTREIAKDICQANEKVAEGVATIKKGG